MATVGAIIAFILTPILWLLYHKVFGVIYFGGVGRGIFKELFGCFIVSIIIVSVFGAFGGALLGLAGGVLGGLLSVILFLLKWILILGAIGGIIYLIYSLITKKKISSDNGSPASNNEAEASAVMQITSEQTVEEVTEDAEPEEPPETKFCAFCGKRINRSQKFCNYCGKECIS